MKGGMSRRYTMLDGLRQQGWPVVVLDVGGIIKGYGKQAELKLQITAEAMRLMKYDAIGLGKNELKIPTGEVVSHVAGVGEKGTPFTSANVGLFGFDLGITPPYQIIERGAVKVGVVSVLGKQAQAELANNQQLQMIAPEAALQKVLPKLKQQRCDLLVLLAHATMEESIALAKQFPDFNVVVTAGGRADPPIEKAELVGRAQLIDVGEKGMNAVVLGYFDDFRTPRYQRVVLDSRYKSSPKIVALMAAYQGQLKDLWDSLLRPVENQRTAVQGAFVGSKKCESCHELSYKVWKKSGHSHAYDTLVKAEPARNNDPECVSCHVIGWHPTDYFPYRGGFMGIAKTPDLIDVGCESCHGPGEKHVAAEMGSNTALQEKQRKALVLTKAESEKHFCATCHDLDNSPAFEFETYWPKIEHKEKE
jgi:hypothetical protein